MSLSGIIHHSQIIFGYEIKKMFRSGTVKIVRNNFLVLVGSFRCQCDFF